MATATKPDTHDAEQRMVLYSVDWPHYELVLRAFERQSGMRITYLDGRLTLVSPSRRHDWFEKVIGRLFETIAEVAGIEIEVAGHSTYRQSRQNVGVEGDQAYYVGPNARKMSGPVEIDLSSQPPPDLVIEVEATHRADESVAAWGRLGVPEIWRLDVERRTLTFNCLQENGTYVPAPRGFALPFVEPNDVLTQIELADQLGWSPWVAQLADWVRFTLLPRRGEQ